MDEIPLRYHMLTWGERHEIELSMPDDYAPWEYMEGGLYIRDPDGTPQYVESSIEH
jgi:hypothetical protein